MNERKPPMTFDEFQTKFRGQFLLFLVESWSLRKESPSSLGLLMDSHAIRLRKLLHEVYEALAGEHGKAGTNGHANGVHALPR